MKRQKNFPILNVQTALLWLPSETQLKQYGAETFICDCECNNRPINYNNFSAQLVAILYLISLLFSGQFLALRKCGIDIMAPVGHAK